MGEKDKESGLSKWSETSGICGHPIAGSFASNKHSVSPGSITPQDQHAPTAARTAQGQPQTQSQHKTFEFVLVTDNESRRQVRRHAMRQYMHQRRLDSIARLGAPRVPAAGWAIRPSDSTCLQAPAGTVEDVLIGGPVKREKGSASSVDEPRIKKERRASEDRVGTRSPMRKHEDAGLALVPKFRYSDPKSMPENGAVQDPFNSYPVLITDADHKLIHHFIVTYPSMMYKFIDSASYTLNPMKEIFRQFALHDDLPFQAMLAIASKHRAGVEGKAESVQSLTHKMRALRLMNERIQVDSEGRNDGTIYAVATMAVIEKWSKDASIERMHFRGLASMIRNRGGMQAMQTSNPFLSNVLYWVDFSCAPKAIVGTALPWTGAVPDTPPAGFDFINPDMHLAIPHGSNAPESAESLCDQYRACEDFLCFFRHLHNLERTALNSAPNLAPVNTPPRRKSFIPGTKLHSMLTLLPDYDHGIRDIRFIDEYTCMTCLFFLAIALYHSYSTSSRFDPYLQWLEDEVDSLNPYETPSITSILWIFLRHGGFAPTDEQDKSGARCWVVSRMVRIAKLLEWKQQGKIWDSLRTTLIDFIVTQQECALSERVVDANALAARARMRGTPRAGFWDENELRKEILGIDNPGQMAVAPFSGIGVENIPALP
ncbi:hypothetical protein BJX61DRAFT_551600 [Aspergillus egyptiacus]|nr:hypothetical protein BJX61DRAFT_551600 [Aspergillus egyptiacus]